MKSLSNIFEKKLIFGIGRHLWNFVSVSGYVTLLTGIILFINSTFTETPKNKSEFVKNEKEIGEKIENTKKEKEEVLNEIQKEFGPKDILVSTKELTLKGWMIKKKEGDISEFPNRPALISLINANGGDITRDKVAYSIMFDRTLKEEDKKLLRDYLDFYDNYDPQKKLIIEKYSSNKAKFETKLKNQQTLLDKKYQSYLNGIESRNSIKVGQRIISPFILGSGLGVIASASITASVLAIERNTRPKDE